MGKEGGCRVPMKHFVRRLFHCQKQPLAEIRRELDQGHTVIAASLAGNGTGLTQLCFYPLFQTLCLVLLRLVI